MNQIHVSLSILFASTDSDDGDDLPILPSRPQRSNPKNSSFRHAVDKSKRQPTSPDSTPHRLSTAFDEPSPPPLPTRSFEQNCCTLDRSFSFASQNLESNSYQPQVSTLPRKKSCPNSTDFIQPHQAPIVPPIPIRRSFTRRLDHTESVQPSVMIGIDQSGKLSNESDNKDRLKSPAMQHQRVLQDFIGFVKFLENYKFKSAFITT